MKKIYLFFLCAFVILTGCRTDGNENINSTLEGKWLLVNVSGGIAGDINNINTKTERHIIIFDNNSSISFFYNDNLLSATGFQIEKGKSIYSTNELNFIIYENGAESEVISCLSNDTLAIADNYYDGYTKVYIRSAQ